MIESLGGGGRAGVRKFLLEREDKPEKGGGVDVEIGGCHFFTTLQFSSITFTVCLGKVRFPLLSDLQPFELAMQDFHPCSHPSLVVKPGIICTFLIHSGSLQKC